MNSNKQSKNRFMKKTSYLENLSFSCYACPVDVVVEFNEAAFKHNVSREDILNALKTKIYAAAIEEFPEKYLVIGFDHVGNPLELLYNPIDDDSIYVFHAMKLRASTKELLGF